MAANVGVRSLSRSDQTTDEAAAPAAPADTLLDPAVVDEPMETPHEQAAPALSTDAETCAGYDPGAKAAGLLDPLTLSPEDSEQTEAVKSLPGEAVEYLATIRFGYFRKTCFGRNSWRQLCGESGKMKQKYL